MSGTLLPIVDLSAAVVGTAGSIALRDMSVSAQPDARATLQLFNESGCGLAVWFGLAPARQFVPAGAWRAFTLPAGEQSLQYVVVYVMPQAQVSQLVGVYYAPGETPAALGVLGNAPAGISGAVAISGPVAISGDVGISGPVTVAGDVGITGPVGISGPVTVTGAVDVTNPTGIVNTGQPLGDNLISAQPLGAAQPYVTMRNDGTLWVYGMNAGVLAQMIKLTPSPDAFTGMGIELGDPASPNSTYVHGSCENAGNATHSLLSDDTMAMGGIPSLDWRARYYTVTKVGNQTYTGFTGLLFSGNIVVARDSLVIIRAELGHTLASPVGHYSCIVYRNPGGVSAAYAAQYKPVATGQSMVMNVVVMDYVSAGTHSYDIYGNGWTANSVCEAASTRITVCVIPNAY